MAVKKREVAKQWHPTKNGNISPFEVGAFARREFWWQCKNVHEWKTSPNSRRSSNCKYCKDEEIK